MAEGLAASPCTPWRAVETNKASVYFLSDYRKQADPLGRCLCSHNKAVVVQGFRGDGEPVSL